MHRRTGAAAGGRSSGLSGLTLTHVYHEKTPGPGRREEESGRTGGCCVAGAAGRKRRHQGNEKRMRRGLSTRLTDRPKRRSLNPDPLFLPVMGVMRRAAQKAGISKGLSGG